MRILICDDERVITEQIGQYLQEYFICRSYEMPELVSLSEGDSLLADTGQKNLVFLDIEMPGSNGILVGKELKKAKPNILIFIITSYMQYLDDAMRFQVFRYLSKPLEKERLFSNMATLRAFIIVLSPLWSSITETTPKQCSNQTSSISKHRQEPPLCIRLSAHILRKRPFILGLTH